MKYTESPLYNIELQTMSDFLELINYRPSTIDGYLKSIFECCCWMKEMYGISLNNADVLHLRAFLLHLKRSKADGGKGLAPRSVNVYNCALKKYFRYVLRRPLSNDELPLCRVDHPLPKVPSKKDAMNLIIGTRNLKHKAELAAAYGAALRIGEVSTLRFRDISFTDGIISIPEDVSKSRYAGKVELPERLRKILFAYWKECCQGARPDDWLFPGQGRVGAESRSDAASFRTGPSAGGHRGLGAPGACDLSGKAPDPDPGTGMGKQRIHFPFPEACPCTALLSGRCGSLPGTAAAPSPLDHQHSYLRSAGCKAPGKEAR